MVFTLEYLRELRKIPIPKGIFIEHQMVPLTKIDVSNEKVTEQVE